MNYQNKNDVVPLWGMISFVTLIGICFFIASLLGCTTINIGYSPAQIDECLNWQVDAYGDLCAEAREEPYRGGEIEAHYEGVKCAADAVRTCLQTIERE